MQDLRRKNGFYDFRYTVGKVCSVCFIHNTSFAKITSSFTCTHWLAVVKWIRRLSPKRSEVRNSDPSVVLVVDDTPDLSWFYLVLFHSRCKGYGCRSPLMWRALLAIGHASSTVLILQAHRRTSLISQGVSAA